MTDIQKLKALAEAQPEKLWTRSEGDLSMMTGARMYYVAGPEGASDWENWGFTRRAASFIAAANPAAVLELIAEIERLREVTKFEDAVACVFDCLKMTAANTSSREWDDLLEELAEEVIEYAPNYKKQWKDICEISHQRDQLQTENTDLHATFQAAKGEIERLRLDNQSKNGSLKALGKKLKDRERQLRKLGGVAGENEALRQQLAVPSDVLADAEALRMDAERYRYVRKHSYVEVRCDSPRKNGWSPELLDVCVDAAMIKDSSHD